MSWSVSEAETIECFSSASAGAFTAVYLPVAISQSPAASPNMGFVVGTSIASVCVVALCAVFAWQAHAGNVKVNIPSDACRWMSEPFQPKKSRIRPAPIEMPSGPSSIPKLAWQKSGLSALSGRLSPKHLQSEEGFWEWAKELVGSPTGRGSIPTLPHSRSLNFGCLSPASPASPASASSRPRITRAKSVPNITSTFATRELPQHSADAKEHFAEWSKDLRERHEQEAEASKLIILPHPPRSARSVHAGSKAAGPHLLPSGLMSQSTPQLPWPHFPPSSPCEEKEEYFKSLEQERAAYRRRLLTATWFVHDSQHSTFNPSTL